MDITPEISFDIPTPVYVGSPLRLATPPTDPKLAEQCRAMLRRWFHVDFTLIDTSTGECAHASADQPELDWESLGELCVAAAIGQRAEFIADETPLLVLAIPVDSYTQAPLVAVGLFLTRSDYLAEELDDAAEQLRIDRAELKAWAPAQHAWQAEALHALAEMLVEKLTTDRQNRQLKTEVDQVTTHLLSTYEEISLVHRLTQNLKLSRTDVELATLALEWIGEVLPAESVAIKLNPTPTENRQSTNGQAEGKFLSYGDCPITQDQVDAFLERLSRDALNVPTVLNRAVTCRASWPFPGVRELIAVPMVEGEKVYGWVFALNHRDGGEFGTVEASLLASVGAILGIHRGNTELYREQAEFLANVVRALTSAIDAKDPYTCGHSDRVARVAMRLAEEMNCDAGTLKTIYLSGLLHDIGKIGIDDNVLRKPGKLTDAEYEHIKLHPELGYKILRDLKQLDEVLPVVLHHHEAWDGRGYPSGLVGEDIPFLARIVAVADSFDAMSSDRPYRRGMPIEKLEDIFSHGAGKQWDPEVVAAFFRAREDIHKIADRECEAVVTEGDQWV